MSIWPFRKRAPQPSPEMVQQHRESVARLAEARKLSSDAVRVSSELRERLEHNGLAEGFRVAMRGT